MVRQISEITGVPRSTVSRILRQNELETLRRLEPKPYTPKANGKVERFIQKLTQKWAYGTPHKNSHARTRALPTWINTPIADDLIGASAD